MFKLSELQLFSSSLLHPIIVTRKKEFCKSFCLILNVIIVLVSLVLHILTKVGILLNRSIALIVLLNMRLDVLGFPTQYLKTVLNASEKLIGKLCYYYIPIEGGLILEIYKKKKNFLSLLFWIQVKIHLPLKIPIIYLIQSVAQVFFSGILIPYY